MSGTPTIYRDIATKELLEREYSPSSLAPDLAQYLRDYASRSARTRERLPGKLNLSYGPAPEEVCDLFLPSPVRSGRTPLCIFIHGGYWQDLSKSDFSFPAEQFGRHGIAFAAVNYGLAPASSLAAMVARCRAAIAYLYGAAGRLGFDRDSILVCGSSAGAHLAAMTLLTDWLREFALPATLIKGAILLSGIYDLRPIRLTYVNDPLQLDVPSALCNSPLLLADFVSATIAPTLIAWGEHETTEFKRQSQEFAAALARRRAAVTSLEVRGRNHFDVLFDLADDHTELGGALLRHLSACLGAAP